MTNEKEEDTKTPEKSDKWTVKRIADAAIDTILSILLAALLFIAVSPRYSVSYISSPSMAPYLAVGAVVITDKDAYDYRTTFPEKDDVIVFYRRSNAGMPTLEVCHRVVGPKDGGYKTKGDNNLDEDIWTVEDDDIVGKVVFKTNLFSPFVDLVKPVTGE